MPPLSEILGNLDGYGTWLAAVVAGLVAAGWLLRKAYRGVRTFHRRATDLGRKIDALDKIVDRELTDGGDSVKSLTRQSASIALAVEGLERRVTALEEFELELRVRRLEEWRSRWGQEPAGP